MSESSNDNQAPATRKLPVKKYLAVFWAIVGAGLLSLVLLLFGIVQGWFGELPSTQKLENPETNLASTVYSKKGMVLGKYYTQNRTKINYDQLSPHLVDALIATEDARFYQHPGIDVQALLRVLFFRFLLGQEDAGGGSTITQQLAKNLFPRQSFSTWSEIIIRKLKEWVIAVRLERYYTKKEILQMYFNTVSFGSNTYGIQSAAQTFFNKMPKNLKPEEAAVLVGALKATHYYSPVFNRERSRKRRDLVLQLMNRHGYLKDSTCDSLQKVPISLSYRKETHNKGPARYFRSHLQQRMKDWCAKNGYNLYTDGLQIHTTINKRMQAHAEKAVYERMADLQEDFFEHWSDKKPWGEDKRLIKLGMRQSRRYQRMKAQGASEEAIKQAFRKPREMEIFTYEHGRVDTVMTPLDSVKYYQQFLQTGVMAMRPSSGEVKAWVGGVNFRDFKYDHVNKGTKRQVGSTFKPFVYTVAAANGFSPCFKVPNTPVVFEAYDNWSPKNASGKYGGMKTIKDGLSQSINCVTARLIKEVGPEAVVKKAKEMGITSPIQPYPSISLGTMDISVYEMVSAFNTFANKGVWTEPIILTRIEDKNGNVLERFVPKTREALSEVTNYIMVDMLKNVVNNGTSVRLRYKYNFQNPIIGKTGTTQNQTDGWFLGAVPDLTTGVWVGGDHRQIRFRNIKLGQGANMALPIWAKFMKRCYADSTIQVSKAKFEKPDQPLPVNIDCEGSSKSNEGSPNQDLEF